MIDSLLDMGKRVYDEASELRLVAGLAHLIRILLLLICVPAAAFGSVVATPQSLFLVSVVIVATILSYKRPPLLWLALIVLVLGALTDQGGKP